MTEQTVLDVQDPRLASRGEGVLRSLNEAGLLEAADVHVARRLGTLGGEADPDVLVATALAVRAVRNGSVCVDLSEVHRLEPDVAWPDPDGWSEAVAASPADRLAWLYLSRCLHGLGRSEESQEALERYRELQVQDDRRDDAVILEKIGDQLTQPAVAPAREDGS